MKIKQIETYPLFYRLTEPYGDANGWKAYRTCYLFRITTESGIDGWGECVDYLPTLEKGFRERVIPYLLGKKSTNRLLLIEQIQKWHPRIAAGVSMALTEIIAKQAGMSVCELWGGSRRDKIPVYASFQSYTPRPNWIQNSLEQVEKVVIEGFSKIKVKIGGRSFQEDVQHLTSLQSLFKGAVQVAVDANQSYDVATALKWNRLFRKEENWLWFEEPLSLRRIGEYQFLRARCEIPIAGGEKMTNLIQFMDWMRQGGLDLIQPDLMHIGGVEPFREILQLARNYGVRVSPHSYDGMLSRIYALFAQSILAPWSKMKGEDVEPVEWDVMENPFTSLIPINVVNGEVEIPTGKGMGLPIDMELLNFYRWDGSSY